MEKMLTFLELLQMASKNQQPSVVRYCGKTYIWNGSDYVAGKRSLGEDVCQTYSVTGLFRQKAIRMNDSILDDREKRYIREALVPLGATLVMKDIIDNEAERLQYMYVSKPYNKEFTGAFPFFKKGTMYNGMEPGRWYTVEELLEEK